MIIRVWDVTFTVTNLDRAVNFYENVLALFHETDLDFSGGILQGLRSAQASGSIYEAPAGAELDRPIGLCKPSPMASASGGVATVGCKSEIRRKHK
jgi:predicted enzyme related to lactoylglutathione lyase